MANPPETASVTEAAATLAGLVRRTPVLASEALDELAGATLRFKAECLQLTGSFKVRGMTNKVRSLSPEELGKGLVTVSAGNAALGAAHATREAGARLVAIMPETAVPEKLAAVAAMGAEVEKAGIRNAAQAFERLAELQAEHGYTLLHPFDDPHVIAGQGTATLELLEEEPDLDAIVVPSSGGGPLAGAVLAREAAGSAAALHGIQPEGADGLARSLESGERVAPPEVRTVADGLTAPMPGVHNLELIRRGGAEVHRVTDDAILEAMALVVRHLRVVVEPAGAAGLAGVLASGAFRGRRVGVLLTGSNVSAELLSQVVS